MVLDEEVKPLIIDEIMVNFPYLSENVSCEWNTDSILPFPFAKIWMYEENIKRGCQLETNQFDLICFVLALRYFKNYDVKIAAIGEKAITKINRFSTETPKPSHVIFLEDDVLAYLMESGMLYTNSLLLMKHKKILGFYMEHLGEAPFCMRLNAAEKHLLNIWLSYVKFMNAGSQELCASLVRRMQGELGVCNINFSRFTREHYFCNELDRSNLLQGMNLAVFQYEKEYSLSDLFVTDVLDTNEYQYIYLEEQSLDNYESKDALTVLNHVRYFDLFSRNIDNSNIIWSLSHYYRQRVESNIKFIFDTRQYFLGSIYCIEENRISGSVVSAKNLRLGQKLYFLPLRTVILEMFQLEKVMEHAKLSENENEILLFFQWTMTSTQILHCVTYSKETKVIELVHTSLDVKISPNQIIKNLMYYEARYSVGDKRYYLMPIQYDDCRDNCYSSKSMINSHGLYRGEKYCGIFKTEHEVVESKCNNNHIEVVLRFYNNRIIYSFLPDQKNSNKHLFETRVVHDIYYKKDKKLSETVESSEIYQLMNPGTMSYDEINLIKCNTKEKDDLITAYYWKFNGHKLFDYSIRDLRILIWEIFIELLSQGYERKNIIWNIQYHSIKEKVSNAMFEHLVKRTISDISLLKKTDGRKYSERDEVVSNDYMMYHIHTDLATQLIRDLDTKFDCDSRGMELIYMSDEAIYVDHLLSDLSIEAKGREHISDGLMTVLKLFGEGETQSLELYGLEFFADEFSLINDEYFLGTVLQKLENLSFRLDHPWYEKISKEMIYIMICVILNAILQLDNSSQIERNKKHLVINFDSNSVLYRMLYRIPFYRICMLELGKMIFSKFDLMSILIGEDLNAESFFEIRRGNKTTKADDSADILYVEGLMNDFIWSEDKEFANRVMQSINWNQIAKSKISLRKNIINEHHYIRNHVSLVKNMVMDSYRMSDVSNTERMIRSNYLGEKSLIFLKDGSIEPREKLNQNYFDIINWGKTKDGVCCIMLLPAVIDKQTIIDKGVVILMDDSVYISKPVIDESSFKSLNNENAKTVANATRQMFDMLEKAYMTKIENHQIEISDLKIDVLQKNKNINDLRELSEQLKDRMRELERERETLENDKNIIKDINAANEKRILSLEATDYCNTVTADYNKYLISNQNKDSFFKKYKRIMMKIEGAMGVSYKRTFFKSGDYLIAVATSNNCFLVFPDKGSIAYGTYEDLLKSTFNFSNSHTLSNDRYKVIKPATIAKQGSGFVLKEKGCIQK